MINMSEVLFVVVALGILVVEIIELRQKCEQVQSDAWEEISFPSGNGRL